MKNLTPKERLVSYLPKEFKNCVEDFVREDGLIDDCKYMLYFTPNMAFNGYESVPCKSYNEAQYFVRNSSVRHHNLQELCKNYLLFPMTVYVNGTCFFRGNGANILAVVDEEILKSLSIVNVQIIDSLIVDVKGE